MTLAEVMKSTSKCGFGQTSPNCFMDIVRDFIDLPEDCSSGERCREGGDA